MSTEPSSLLPPGISYGVKPRKGTYYGQPLVAWAAIDKCNATRCRIVDLCTYEKSNGEGTKKCGVQRGYIGAVSEMIHQTFHVQIKNDQQLLFKVGMHLIPLYKTLCKLKMEELAVNQPVFLTLRGDRKPDPVFREIRETLKIIMMCWKDLGLSAGVMGALPVNPRGDTGYEAELFEEEPEETKAKLNIGGQSDAV